MKASIYLFALLLFYAPLHAVPVDKAAHFGASFVIASTCHVLLRKFSPWGVFARQVTCMAATGTVGIGKEVYDRQSGGSFSNNDIRYDTFGAVASSALFYADEVIREDTQPAVIPKPPAKQNKPASKKKSYRKP